MAIDKKSKKAEKVGSNGKKTMKVHKVRGGGIKWGFGRKSAKSKKINKANISLATHPAVARKHLQNLTNTHTNKLLTHLIENPDRLKRFNEHGMMIKGSKGLQKEFGDILKGLSGEQRKIIINKARSAYGNNVSKVVSNLSGYTKSGRAISSFVDGNGNFKTGMAPESVAGKYNLLTNEQKKLVGKRLSLQKSITEQINTLRQTPYTPKRNENLQKLLELRNQFPSISQKREQLANVLNKQRPKNTTSTPQTPGSNGYASPNPLNSTETETKYEPTTSQQQSRTETLYAPLPTQNGTFINAKSFENLTNLTGSNKKNSNIQNIYAKIQKPTPPQSPPLPPRLYSQTPSKTYNSLADISNALKKHIQSLNTGILATNKSALLNYMSGKSTTIPAIIPPNISNEIEAIREQYSKNSSSKTNNLLWDLRKKHPPPLIKSNLALLNSRLRHLIPSDSMNISLDTRNKYIKYLKNADLQDLQYSLPMTIEQFIKEQK